ncbi:histidine kinase [Cupriavidus basilensis]
MMRLNSVRERERATVAQELHDVVGGMLTTIRVRAFSPRPTLGSPRKAG